MKNHLSILTSVRLLPYRILWEDIGNEQTQIIDEERLSSEDERKKLKWQKQSIQDKWKQDKTNELKNNRWQIDK